MAQDLFAPPTKEELQDDLFAPPTPDELIDDKEISAMGPAATFAASALDIATLGYGPNVLAGLKTGSITSPEYIAERDKLNEILKLSQKENKKSGYTGMATGALATAALPAAAVVRGAGLASKVLGGAAMGAAAGALQDTPEAEGKLTTPEIELSERAKQAGIGAGVGAFLPVAGSVIPDEIARGFSALGPSKKAVMESLKAEKGGKVLSRENIVSFAKQKGILRFGSDVDQMYPVAIDTRRAVGSSLSDIYKQAAEAAKQKLRSDSQYVFSRNSLDDLKNKAVAAVDVELKTSKNKNLIKQEIADYFDEMKTSFPDAIPDITDLHDIKMALGGLAKYQKNAAKSGSGIADAEKAWANTERIVANEIESAIEGLSKEAPQLGTQLKQLNKEYQLAKFLEDTLENRVAGDASTSRAFGLDNLINETLQPRINSALSGVAGSGNVIADAVNKALGPLAPKAQNIPFAAPMLMQQSTMSPMERYKYEKQGGQ